jgi:murein DD-endopeptidase MepM/ murein hydrolase activator NlpD
MAVPAGLALAAPAAVAVASEPAPQASPTVSTAQLLGAVTGPSANPLQRPFAARRPHAPRRPRAFFPVRGSVSYGDAVARFGNNRGDHSHGGQDVFAKAGTPLVAVARGVVVEAGTDGGRGNHVEIYVPGARRTFAYFHMQAPTHLRVGQRVRAGQRIGRVGCTGRCFGDHLHFEVHKGRGIGAPKVDPLPLLRKLHTRTRRHGASGVDM